MYLGLSALLDINVPRADSPLDLLVLRADYLGAGREKMKNRLSSQFNLKIGSGIILKSV